MPQSPTLDHDQAVKDELLESVRRMTPAQAAQLVRDLEAVSRHIRELGEEENFLDFLLEGEPRPLQEAQRTKYEAALDRYCDLHQARQADSVEAVNLLDDLAYMTTGHIWCAMSRLESVLDAVACEERPAYWMVAR